MLKSTVDYPNNNFTSIESRCQAMEYEIINIRTYYANCLESTRQAKLFPCGRIEELPEPDYPDDEEETQSEEGDKDD
jgi:hypothetical protein